MVAAFAGMFIGQAVRTRMQPEAFRRWFLIAMILLGLYLAGSALRNSLVNLDSDRVSDVDQRRLQHRDADAEIDEQAAERAVDPDHRAGRIAGCGRRPSPRRRRRRGTTACR